MFSLRLLLTGVDHLCRSMDEHNPRVSAGSDGANLVS